MRDQNIPCLQTSLRTDGGCRCSNSGAKGQSQSDNAGNGGDEELHDASRSLSIKVTFAAYKY